jgi:hypothetical protein
MLTEIPTPVNRHPILMCARCQVPLQHHFLEKRKSEDTSGSVTKVPHTDLIFECGGCNTQRVYGREA